MLGSLASLHSVSGPGRREHRKFCWSPSGPPPAPCWVQGASWVPSQSGPGLSPPPSRPAGQCAEGGAYAEPHAARKEKSCLCLGLREAACPRRPPREPSTFAGTMFPSAGPRAADSLTQWTVDLFWSFRVWTELGPRWRCRLSARRQVCQGHPALQELGFPGSTWARGLLRYADAQTASLDVLTWQVWVRSQALGAQLCVSPRFSWGVTVEKIR